MSLTTRRNFLIWTGAMAGARFYPSFAADLPGIAPQPYFAGVSRAVETLSKLGAPIAVSDAQQLAALTRQNDDAAIEATEKILDRYTLARLALKAHGTVSVTVGGAKRSLIEQGWQMFLMRIENPDGRLDSISFGAANMPESVEERLARVAVQWPGAAREGLRADTINEAPLIDKTWLLSRLDGAIPISLNGIETPPVVPLSGIPIEYRVIELFSRDCGPRKAELSAFSITKSVAANASAESHKEFDFQCLPSRIVTLNVRDGDGRGCVASLTIKDTHERIYPPQAMRLAPDMFFQEQIYRGDGETVRLPDGEFIIESRRGPEYLLGVQTVKIDASNSQVGVNLRRWIDPAKWDWYSGDTHIHAAGCLHYQRPSEGVSPETMIRHVRGEGISVGDVLSWGPSWYYQKQFFTAHTQSPAATLEHPELQVANRADWKPQRTAEDAQSLLRYDVEVSGFPSSHAGHLVLLRLKDQDYPGTKTVEDWPSWNLPVLQWAKSQGAVAGYAHCGWGMVVDSTDLPNYEIPPMDGNGTQEGIIDITHGAIDFLSGCDGLPVAELNAWYHLLNCGFRLAMVGETDFPCATGERVGVGRSYVRLEARPQDDSGYDAWIRGIQAGRLYCGDGRSHFLDFKVQKRRSGEPDVELKSPTVVTVEALIAARLEPTPTADTETIRQSPYIWHIEKARIGTSREVPVELLINGLPVDKTILLADGEPRKIEFKTRITRSSWVALRVLPSGHTHPVFVTVAGKPIRASKRSARWCRACVDKVWEVKSPFIRESERAAAAGAFDHARKTYDSIVGECEVD